MTKAARRKECDTLCRNIVMIKAGAVEMEKAGGKGYMWYGKCQWCTKERPLYWAHIFSVQHYAHLKWDPDNALALCYYCHIQRWHKDPTSAIEFVTRTLGENAYAKLKLRAAAGGYTDLGATLIWLKKEEAALRTFPQDGA